MLVHLFFFILLFMLFFILRRHLLLGLHLRRHLLLDAHLLEVLPTSRAHLFQVMKRDDLGGERGRARSLLIGDGGGPLAHTLKQSSVERWHAEEARE